MDVLHTSCGAYKKNFEFNFLNCFVEKHVILVAISMDNGLFFFKRSELEGINDQVGQETSSDHTKKQPECQSYIG